MSGQHGVAHASFSLYQNSNSAWSDSSRALGFPPSCGGNAAERRPVLLAASTCFDCLSQRSPQAADSPLGFLIEFLTFLLNLVGVPSPVRFVLLLINAVHATNVTVAQVLTSNPLHLGWKWLRELTSSWYSSESHFSFFLAF